MAKPRLSDMFKYARELPNTTKISLVFALGVSIFSWTSVVGLSIH